MQNALIQVEDLDPTTNEEQGEQPQEHELSQWDEPMDEQLDAKMEQSKQDQDTDLMPKAIKVIPQASQNLVAEQVPSEQGDTNLLEDDLEADVYNIAFNESQHRVEQARRVHILDEHASPAHFE